MKKLNMKSVLTALLSLAALGFLLFGLTSYHYYSTIGIDNERIQGDQVDYRYYRFWWPGNGALLVGFGETIKPYNPKVQYDLFDPAGTLLRSPYKPLEVQSLWNRLGFWWINNSNPRQFWVGVPALLPAFLLCSAWWRLRKR